MNLHENLLFSTEVEAFITYSQAAGVNHKFFLKFCKLDRTDGNLMDTTYTIRISGSGTSRAVLQSV